MEVTIIKRERLKLYPGKFFIYFIYNGREEKTIISRKVLNYLKVDDLRTGDKVEVIKGYRNNIKVFLVRNII